MYIFDASSAMHAWDNYPMDNFPPLWDWFAEQIDNGLFSIPQVAFEEVSKKLPECGAWLKEKGIQIHALSNAVLKEAALMKRLLGITEDDYHPNGVGENDLIIIATAKISGLQLVSEEGQQFRLPDNMKKCKIPAVCGLPEVGVACIQFIELIKTSGAIFR
jgi:hypothetical protein